MGLYRIPITKDTTISTYKTFGNAGASQIVDVWGFFDEITGKKYLARTLAQTSLTALQSAIASADVPDPAIDSTVTCELRFFNINHADTQAYDFTLWVFPATTNWAEGQGTRIDTWVTTGYACWASASPTASWVNSGGDYSVDSSSASQYFETGYENLNVNIRTMLNNWLSGASANNGFFIRMNDVAEDLTGATTSNNAQYYRKSFHGRYTNFPNFAPFIELRWDDTITDQRNAIVYGNSSKLYFYNLVNGQFTDISGSGNFSGYVSISGLSGGKYYTVNLQSLTASRVKKGIYSVSFTLPLTASSYTAFTDTWTITSSVSAVTPSIAQTFTAQSPVQNQQSVDFSKTNLKIINWKHDWDKGNVLTKRVFVSQRTGKVETVLVQSEKNSISSIASSAVSSLVVTDGYYRVFVPAIGVADTDWTALGYDEWSNFFTLDTSQYARGVEFSLQFKLNIDGQTYLIDNDPSLEFRVV